MSILLRCTNINTVYNPQSKSTIETATLSIEGNAPVSLEQPLKLITKIDANKGVIKSGKLYALQLSELPDDPAIPTNPPVTPPAPLASVQT